jgi:ribose transport system permease protein
LRPSISARFLLAEGGVLAVLLLAWSDSAHGTLNAADWSGFLMAVLPLAVAAMVQTVPILAGGQGLAAGATAFLVDAVMAGAPIDGPASAALWIAIGLAIGGAVGLGNGLLIGYLRVPSTAVTYATGAGVGALAFIVYGHGLIIERPQPHELADLLFGTGMLGVSVVPVLLLALMVASGIVLQRSRFGRALTITGARFSLAERVLPAARLRCLAYMIAGLGYAVAGIVLAGQVGTLDSMLAMPVLLQIFAAAALGGGCPGLRAGSMVGALLGAAIVTAVANLFVPVGIPDILSPAVDAGWLLVGLVACFRFADRVPHIVHRGTTAIVAAKAQAIAAAGVLLLLGLVILRPEAATLATAGVGIGLLALGQGAVIRSGGFDLSMPAVMTAAGVMAVTISQGSWLGFLVAAVVIAAAAALLGLWHAHLARRLGRGIVLATLASAGLLQAVATAMFVWAPTGFVPLDLTALVSRTWLHLPIPVWILLPAGIAAGFALDRTWRQGDRHPRLAYVASTLAAAMFGILLACIGGTFRVGLVEPFLVPAVAGAVIGGVRFARGDGSLLAAFGAALVVQVTDTLLVALGLSYEARLIVIALAMLAAATLPQLKAGRLRRRPA